jgi:hypothetical protein
VTLKAQFTTFDAKLAKKGVPPLTEWWMKRIGKWLDVYERGQVLELWGCVGRGAAKSTAIYKLATFFSLFGDFKVPPGETHYAIVLSRLKEEASKGVDIIASWLRLLGIKHTVAGDVITLTGERRGIRVVAASVAATSGWRAFFIGKDERSKWPADGATEQDAAEIDTSATAMTATHALAPVVAFGSAWGAFGDFYDAIMGGSDDRRMVVGPSPTWIAAPHITEASTRRKERDVRRWRREYACEFQAGVGSAFDADFVRLAFEPKGVEVAAEGQPVIVVDASGGKGDAFTWGVCRWVATTTGRSLLVFEEVAGVTGAFWGKVSADQIVARIKEDAVHYGAVDVHADQYAALAYDSAFRRAKLHFHVHNWSQASKAEGVMKLRRLLSDGDIVLPEHERLLKELLNYEEKLSPRSGEVTYGARSGHDDFASLIVTAMMVDLDRRLRAPKPKTAATGPTLCGGYPNSYDDSFTEVYSDGSTRKRAGNPYKGNYAF